MWILHLGYNNCAWHIGKIYGHRLLQQIGNNSRETENPRPESILSPLRKILCEDWFLETAGTQLKSIIPTFPPALKLQKGLQESHSQPLYTEKGLSWEHSKFIPCHWSCRYFWSDKTSKQKCAEGCFGQRKCVNSLTKNIYTIQWRCCFPSEELRPTRKLCIQVRSCSLCHKSLLCLESHPRGQT